jgi:hypothetical protein
MQRKLQGFVHLSLSQDVPPCPLALRSRTQRSVLALRLTYTRDVRITSLPKHMHCQSVRTVLLCKPCGTRVVEIKFRINVQVVERDGA